MPKSNIKKPHTKEEDKKAIKGLILQGLSPQDIYNARLKQGLKHPKIRTIQIYAVDSKKIINTDKFQRLAKPWAILSTIDEIPTEVLPIVLQVCVYVQISKLHLFTVRDALWVSRLHAIPKEYYLLERHNGIYPPGYLEKLSRLSHFYAEQEAMQEIAGDKYGMDSPEFIFYLYKNLTGKNIPQNVQDDILKKLSFLEQIKSYEQSEIV